MSDRRNSPGLVKRIKAFIWPKKGFVRAWKYLAFRLSRLNTTPHAIAAGFASGAAASFTPLLGLHFILACGIAFVTRGSMIAAAFGTLIGNPVTFPVVFSATYWVGARIRDLAEAVPSEPFDEILDGLGEEAEADAAAEALLDAAEDFLVWNWSYNAIDVIWPMLATMLVGAILLAPIAFAIFYFAARMILHSMGRR